MDPLQQLADFACDTRLDDIPAATRTHLARIVADTVGAFAAGHREPEMRAITARQTAEVAPGAASVVGTPTRLNPLDAAALNACAGCWLELDEGNLSSNGHPGIQVLPTALAVAQQRGASGAEFFRAFAIGYEVVARIGSACDMRMSIHPHGTYGVAGAAVAAGLLQGLGAADMRELISLAAGAPMAGNRQGMKEGATLRNWYASHSAVMGQTAVRLVQSGFTGPRDGVAVTCGEVLFDNFRPDDLLRGLGRDWLATDGYIKLYGCGRPIHAAIDALRDALAPLGGPAHWPRPEEVERIDIRGFKFLAFLGSRDIRNAFATRFSTPFAVASVLAHRSHGIECFDDAAAAHPAALALMERVTLREDPAFSAQFPAQQRCDLDLVLTDGRVLHGRCDVIRGEPAHPAPESEYRDKFFNMARTTWSPDAAGRLHAQLLSIDSVDDLGTLDWAGTPAVA